MYIYICIYMYTQIGMVLLYMCMIWYLYVCVRGSDEAVVRPQSFELRLPSAFGCQLLGRSWGLFPPRPPRRNEVPGPCSRQPKRRSRSKRNMSDVANDSRKNRATSHTCTSSAKPLFAGPTASLNPQLLGSSATICLPVVRLARWTVFAVACSTSFARIAFVTHLPVYIPMITRITMFAVPLLLFLRVLFSSSYLQVSSDRDS